MGKYLERDYRKALSKSGNKVVNSFGWFSSLALNISKFYSTPESLELSERSGQGGLDECDQRRRFGFRHLKIFLLLPIPIRSHFVTRLILEELLVYG